MCEAITESLLALVNFALGILAAIIGHRWLTKRRGVDDFAAAVSDEIRDLSLRSDNLDASIIEWHFGSVRRLDAFSLYLRTNEQRTWKKIQSTWDDYCLTGKPKTIAAYGENKGRDGLMLRLSALLYALRKT